MSGQENRQLVFRPDRLADEIDARVLTNAEAARMLGVTEKTLLRWRHGQYQPHRSNLRRMAEVFEREPRWFVEVEDVAA